MTGARALALAAVLATTLGSVDVTPDGAQQTQHLRSLQAAYSGAPYTQDIMTIPGKIEAEYFDIGGQNKAYHHIEVNVPMPANVMRETEGGYDIDVQINDVDSTTNPGASEGLGQVAVGMIVSGEWLRYTVEVARGGDFNAWWRIATFDPDFPLGHEVLVRLSAVPIASAVDGGNPCKGAMADGGLDLENINTGDYKAFELFQAATPLRLKAGKSVLTVCFDKVTNFEMNWVNFRRVPDDGPGTDPVDGTSSMASETSISDGGASSTEDNTASAGADDNFAETTGSDDNGAGTDDSTSMMDDDGTAKEDGAAKVKTSGAAASALALGSAALAAAAALLVL